MFGVLQPWTSDLGRDRKAAQGFPSEAREASLTLQAPGCKFGPAHAQFSPSVWLPSCLGRNAFRHLAGRLSALGFKLGKSGFEISGALSIALHMV